MNTEVMKMLFEQIHENLQLRILPGAGCNAPT